MQSVSLFQVIIDSVRHIPIHLPVSLTKLRSSNLTIEMAMFKSSKNVDSNVEKKLTGAMMFLMKVRYCNK